jgi:beta-glucosidase
MESYGEDPHFTARAAEAIVKGYQGSDTAQPDTLMACPKHFAGTGYAAGGRDYEFVDISPLTFHETILPPFVAAIRAGAGSLMAAFNDVGGYPCHANATLLTNLLRHELLFDGMVPADYNGVPELEKHGLGDGPAVSAHALKAGVDMDMAGESYSAHLRACFASGKVSMNDIDRACRRVLHAKHKLGLLDHPLQRMDENRHSSVAQRAPQFRQKAREAAARSCVLLKNAGGILPLSSSARTIAVIGPLADSADQMYGNWAPTSDGTPCVSILEGLRNAVGTNAMILHARGANIYDSPDVSRRAGCHEHFDYRAPEAMRAEAMALVQRADLTVIVAGEAKGGSGEHSSVTDLRLSRQQQALMEVTVQAGKPVVLVLVSGRPLVLSWEDAHMGAILWAPFGGTEAGNGVADVLTGAYNPSGKVTVTFPRHVGQVPIYYALRRGGRPLDPARPFDLTSYIDNPSTELYPFSHGLSYTTFEYGPVRLSKTKLAGDQTLTASVTVTNTGDREGEETTQLYIRQPVASRTRTLELKGFQKRLLGPGEKHKFVFKIRQQDLSFPIGRTIEDVRRAWEPGEFRIFIGPNVRALQEASLVWDADSAGRVSHPV